MSSLLDETNNTSLIISFAGSGDGVGMLNLFEFKNFLKQNYSNYDRHFYIDYDHVWYHKGIKDISTNIDETVKYLQEKINKYSQVIFIGSSAGGYAAILFGSLLKVNIVITFNAQTLLPAYRNGIELQKEYRDLKFVINNETQYFIHGDISIKDENDLHHIKHTNNLININNVHITYHDHLDLKEFRNSGLLLQIFKSHI
jgi:uncharacterized protein YneR